MLLTFWEHLNFQSLKFCAVVLIGLWFIGFPIHQDCIFSFYNIFHFKFSNTTDLLLTKNFMPVIMQCNTATSSSRATVRVKDPEPKAQTYKFWADKASLFISAQSQLQVLVSHGREAPANGTHEIMHGRCFKEIPVTWYTSRIIWVLLRCTLITHFKASHRINLHDQTALFHWSQKCVV